MYARPTRLALLLWLAVPFGPGEQRATSVARAQIATAVCFQEARCARIGPGRRYPTRDACVGTLSGVLDERFNPWQCPYGVDGALLRRASIESNR